jgi:hypothetical protein
LHRENVELVDEKKVEIQSYESAMENQKEKNERLMKEVRLKGGRFCE